MIAMHQAQTLDIRDVREAAWNANKVAKATLNRIRRSLDQFGSVENLIVRPHWCIGARTTDELDEREQNAMMGLEEPWYECLSGNHRLMLYRENGLSNVQAVVLKLPDPQAKMLAQAMNRLGGKDDPDKLSELLRDVLADTPPADVSKLLPHSENDLMRLLTGEADDDAPEEAEGPAVSQAGTIYELGPHRLLCGDSCDAAAVAELLGGMTPTLMVTDPPYGVALDQGWRAEAIGGGGHSVMGSAERYNAQDDRIAGDEGFSWTPALGLPKADVVYLWHAAIYGREAEDALIGHGYKIRQQIIWDKGQAPVSRSAYHWQHEPCWYAVRKNATANWHGGHNQSTVWTARAPRQIMGRNALGSEDARQDHPTQKPVRVFEIPIVNHLNVGEVVYDPFLGSGTCLIAAAKTDRVCYGVELEPKYVDLIRRRWTKWARDNGRDPGSGALA